MQFHQITYFLRSCDTLNFTRAAETCHVSQPSLSAAIQKLEEQLGGALFDRDGRSLKLTSLGESMRIHLSRIELARDAANVAASDIVRDESNIINLGVMCTLSPRQLVSAIASFGCEAACSELLIHDVWESRALELLLSGAFHCIVMAHTEDLPERFVVQRLTDEPMMVAMGAAHPLADRDSIGFSELHDQRYVDRLRCEFRVSFFEELRKQDLKVKIVLRSDREDLVAESISEAVGISIMPQSAAENAGLKTCALDDMSINRRISVVTVRDRQVPASVQQFIEHVEAAHTSYV